MCIATMTTIQYEHVNISYKDVPELKEFFLEDVQRTGERLGSGAFGVVEELKVGGTLYAGKKLHATLLDAHNQGSDRMINRFICECKLMAKIRHPNIVQFMGLCMFDESVHPVLVMEKLDVNFEYILDTHKNVPLPLILRIFKDINKGLIHMHCQKPPIIHRDLTARNILINQASMSAKIADLGNALMIDPVKLSNTLSQAPGTLPYMPPEALQFKPTYDSTLDMFSFGHLALYAIIQVYPGDLLPPTYHDPSTEEIKGRSEVERREKYIRMLYAKLTEDHVVTKMILQCLHNMPERRLTAIKILEQLISINRDENDPYEMVNLIALISSSDRGEPKLTGSVETSILKHRVKEFKEGVPGVLDIFRLHGKAKLIYRKQDWRSQVFQIKDGFLKYFRNNVKDKPHDELDLSLVVRVKAIPPKENMSMFHFEVHFSGKEGSPWLLRAYTQDERTCWMEAIEPGSSTRMTSPIADSYEMVSLPLQGDAYSYVRHKHVVEPQQPPAVLYDEPDTISTTKIAHAVYDLPSPSPAEYDNVIQTSTTSQSSLEQKPTSSHNEFRAQTSTADDSEEDDEVYEDFPDGLYEPMEPTYDDVKVQPTLQRSITIPQTLESISELTLENLTNLDQKQAQLWMLLQMQKMVQKMEDVYEPLKPPANIQLKTKPTAASNTTPSPPLSPPPKEIEELYDEDIGSDLLASQQQNHQDAYVNLDSLQIANNQQPTHQDVYINLDTISEALTAALPPPVPPRTYQQSSADKKEFQIGHHRDRTQSELLLRHTPNAASKPDYDSSISQRLQRSTTLSQDHDSGRHDYKPSQFLAQDKFTPAQLHPSSLPQQATAKSVVTLQKRETSKAEIISTLKASNRAISAEIASHLVTDDDDGTVYAPGKRPEWTKAKTRSSGLEPSLADLHREALFLLQSTLKDLKEIGQGQYGKVFKGLYKRSESPGYPVAIKTIKQYESEKEKDEFLKEMNVMSKLMHPNIVRLFGLVQQDEPWIVLEYLPHGDLKNFLIKNKKPVERLIKYMLDVSTGMHYISEKGLVHRDLAARNIMVSQDEICKVGDFGLLRELPKDVEIYVAKTKVALPIRWMAPESLMRKEFSPATDVWSFGVVMWEMYNPKGKPYKGMNNTQVAVNVNQGERLCIPEEYPPTVTSIMKACWQHSPSKRPSFLLISSLLTKLLWN